jgi:hypothetical protein
MSVERLLFRDFETRSTVELTRAGAWRYATDPTTQVICVGYAIDAEPVQIWRAGQPIPEVFFAAERDPRWLIVAHNAQFVRSSRACSAHATAGRSFRSRANAARWRWRWRRRCRARSRMPPRPSIFPTERIRPAPG